MLGATLVALVLTLSIATLLARSPSGRACFAHMGSRASQIDGLRGFSALLVAAHHLVYVMRFTTFGAWKIARADHVLESMGKASVAYFFLICAYLFWGKMTRPDLRLDRAFLLHFARGRIRRLLPLYLFAMAFALLVVGYIGEGGQLRQDGAETIVQILRSISFSFFGTPSFNGSFLTSAATGVSWSLRYEWVFYVVLPAFILMRFDRLWFVTLPGLVVVNAIFFRYAYVDYFAYGAITCELAKPNTSCDAVLSKISRPMMDVLSILPALFVLCAFTGDEIAFGSPAPMLALSFLAIVRGADWCGLLRSDATRFIGAISYSVYLLNIPMFYVMVGLGLDCGARGMAGALIETLGLVGVLAVSTLSYRWIERPFMTGRPRTTSSGAAPPVDGGWRSAATV